MKKIYSLIMASCIFMGGKIQAQMNIGSTSAPNSSAMLQVSSSNKGFLPPQIALTSSTDASTITSPATGLLVYCTGASSLAAGYYYWNGSSWVSLALGSNPWLLSGNSGTSSLTNFLGTSDNHPLVFKTNNVTKLFIDSTTTYVGIGNTKPQSKLDILGTKASNNTTVNAIDSVNDYIQFNIQNLSLGTGGQSGYTATANNGTNTTNFAWMGINNQNFNNPQQWNIGGGDDVSFMGFGNNMYISNMSTSSPIIFTTGKSTTPYYNERMRITNAGNIGIGTTSPNTSAALDVTATNQGFLPPRVSLTSTTDVSTISSPATGLLVYNTATAGASPNIVTPGYYYYNGTSWGPINSTYSPGQVIKMTMLPYGSISQASSTTVSSTSPTYTTLATYSYTPASSSSTIIIEYNTAYTNSGSTVDTWASQILVGSTQIVYNNQNWVNASGGGTRSGTLFPLMGAYTNSSTSAITIKVQATRISSDDNFIFYGDASTWLKITEIAR